MIDKLLLALDEGIAYYPCSGFDFEMINTIHKFQPRTKNFIYCNSENADGWSLNTEEFIPQIERNGFQYEEFETMLIEEIHKIKNIYHQLGISYGAEYNTYVEGIQNTVTLYKFKNWDDVEFNLFYFRAEALTLFYWLNDLNSNSIKKGNNTLIIKAPNGQWIGTEEFIKLLHEQAQLFNTTAIYNGFKEVPYQLVNQN
jgi:hypothetical protein